MSLKLLLLILTIRSSLEKNYSDVTRLLGDFLSTQNVPSKITTHVCWPKVAKIVLWTMLAERNLISRTSTSLDLLPYLDPEQHQLFILDLDCFGSDHLLKMAEQRDLFRQPFRWILLGSSNSETLSKFNPGIDSKVFLINQFDADYRIESVYKLTKNSQDIFKNDVAKWNRMQGFSWINELTTSKNRSDLMGLTLRVSYVITDNDTFNHLEDLRDRHIDAISKVNWFLLHHLISFMNATSESIFRTTWGYKDARTGIYTGLIGDLQTGNAELGGTPSFFTLDRIDIVDFTAATSRTYMKFIFRAPPLSYVTNVFTLPFDSDVWYCCFILVAVIIIAVYVIVLWEWRDPVFRVKTEAVPNALRPDFFDVVLMQMGTVSQQGSDAEPQSNAGRIITIFSFLTLMFLYTSYSANIVALLQSTTENMRTPEDLLNSRISLGVEDIVYAHYYFENAQEPTRKAIYQQKVAPKGQKSNFMNIHEGMKKVQGGFFAFHVELSSGYKIIADTFQENEKCALKEIAYINLIEPWLSVRKRSPYKEIVKVGMRKIHESGIQQRETNLIYTKKPVCHSKGSNFGSVGLVDCYSAFLFFGVGLCASCLLLLFEILLKKYKPKRGIIEEVITENTDVEEEFRIKENDPGYGN